ncbi:AcrR family transcriptional regulator [Nocardiopsis arvandica]|uniref:AcrR family transcriptional regulator n=1 Tax=Nocardiopsis sinuspersici TaxID=501010 RepID=A0A7Z0BL52_9ACTN|nr:TetR family transcriptional regulator C-terminal domain-containing protein [Nocardiopsis sinuspersici]NYH53192.1 AcrR family transcriptional regulator [Nocardiopsis sinuspersici]
MARTADHEQRRRQVAEALLRAVGERGLARTTLADVADQAGVSIGLVQSYFRTKSQLLRFGVEYLYKQGENRLRAVGGDGLPVASVRDWVFRAAETLLPLDGERRAELTVWLEFLPTTMSDPEMSRLHRDTTGALVDMFTQALEEARRGGELTPDADARTEAADLVAFVDGLTLHRLVTGGVYSDDAVRAALDTYLDRLLPAPESP